MKKILSVGVFAVLFVAVIAGGGAEARGRTHVGVGLHFLFDLSPHRNYGYYHRHHLHSYRSYAPKIYLEFSDYMLLSEKTNYTLETARSGLRVRWINPETGIEGSVVARPAYKNARGQFCRAYEQTLRDVRLVRRGFDTACRLPGGEWENDSQR
jgi:hypothetical protein